MSDQTPNSLGPYEIRSVLGRGAMGVVYRGWDPVGAREVALKTIRADMLSGSEKDSLIKRFWREAAVTQTLKHPNIITVYDKGKAGASLYLAMELIEGQELKAYAEREVDAPLVDLLSMMVAVLEALAHAHDGGIVHRDVKPANVLVTRDLLPKLMDFGIAHIDDTDMTRVGTLMGTPSYMAPEQFLGEAVDARSDIFAAGVMLYHLVTGRKPFQGGLAQVMRHVLYTAPPPPSVVNPGLPSDLDAVVAKALEKRREDRFPSARAFAAALWPIIDLVAEEAARSDDGIDTVAEPAAEPVPEPGPETAREEAAEDDPPFLDNDATLADFDAGPMVPLSEESLFANLAQFAEDLTRRVEAALTDEISSADMAAIDRVVTELCELALAGHMDATDTRRSVILDRCLEWIGGTALPTLRTVIADSAPVPGQQVGLDYRMDWQECIDLFLRLESAMVKLGRPRAPRAVRADLCRALCVPAMMYSSHISRLLDSQDILEINKVSMDFMRLEVLQMALEQLGGDAELRRVRENTRVLAGQVMRKVVTTIQTFTTSGDELARFDVASLMVAIDGLIVMANRLIEVDPDAKSADAYTRAFGRDIIADFISQATVLLAMILAELRGAVRDGDTDRSFAGKLRQVAWLYLFSVRLQDEESAGKLAELNSATRDAVAVLAADIAAAIIRSRKAGDAPREAALIEMFSALHQVAEDLGWKELAAYLVGQMREYVVRQVMAK